MITSPEVNQLSIALSKAQGSIVNPEVNKTVKVSTKDGRSYSYEYADLSTVINSIKKPLSENELTYVTTIVEKDSSLSLCCRIMHSSGQWIQSDYPLFRT